MSLNRMGLREGVEKILPRMVMREEKEGVGAIVVMKETQMGAEGETEVVVIESIIQMMTQKMMIVVIVALKSTNKKRSVIAVEVGVEVMTGAAVEVEVTAEKEAAKGEGRSPPLTKIAAVGEETEERDKTPSAVPRALKNDPNTVIHHHIMIHILHNSNNNNNKSSICTGS